MHVEACLPNSYCCLLSVYFCSVTVVNYEVKQLLNVDLVYVVTVLHEMFFASFCVPLISFM